MSQIRRAGLVLAIVAVSGLLVAFGASRLFAADYDAEELKALAEKIQNDQPGFKIDLAIEGEKTAFKSGESVVFTFTADQDCYLPIFNIGTSGQMIVLFPNKFNPDNKIEKGRTYRIPADETYQYQVTGPTGTETIKAIASVEPIMIKVASLQGELKRPLEQSSDPGGTFLTMKDPKLVLKDIAMVTSGTPSAKWATITKTFQIEEGASPGETSGPPSPTEGQQQESR